MEKEKTYSSTVGKKHIKSFGQFFTKPLIADFMCNWACKNANSILDPAVGNSVFLLSARKVSSCCELTGYEIDNTILDYFGNPSSANIRNCDYLLNDWDSKFDAIVCNPPYNRFQSVINRDEIIRTVYDHTGIRYSGYTNLYILFLAKSIYQLSENGRLAYIIPSEFMNSKYGTEIKKFLIDHNLLNAIINFENDDEIFFNATTTCCILLLDRTPKKYVSFYNLSSIQEITEDIFKSDTITKTRVEYDKLSASDKWHSYFSLEDEYEYINLKNLSQYCSISRGIATGANDYFCFSLSKAKQYNIPQKCLTKCICHSSDIKKPIFDENNFESLSSADKTVYLLDISPEDYYTVEPYIEYGKMKNIDKKYLPSCRKQWYTMEQKNVAPIWVTSACRMGIKFVRNLAQTKSLTTFHSVFIKQDYFCETDLIFCYFLTPIAQSILLKNRKELGNGLDKFQPGDLNDAQMLDISIISTDDKSKIMSIYKNMISNFSDSQIEELNSIFTSYLIK